MEYKSYNKNNESGFALLITIIVVGVILSVGLSVLDLSIKQLRLSSTATDSEISFHAANAGAECARYWRRVSSALFVNGNSISPTCFGVSTTVSPSQVPSGSLTDITPVTVGSGEVFQYEYEFTWGTDARCTQINTITASSSAFGTGVTVVNMNQLIDGYPSGVNFFCDSGSQCTTISVKGYNRACSAVSGYGIVQREVLLQY
jgi:hypothetical protein